MSEITELVVPPLGSTIAHREDNTTTLDKQKDGLSVSEKAISDHIADMKSSIPQLYTVSGEKELWWSQMRYKLREPFSEFFGVFILILFGEG